MSYYVHEVPGRLRIKIPSLKRNEKESRKLEAFLRGIDGVANASVNQMTGSMVVQYDKSVTRSNEILRLLSSEGHIDGGKVIPSAKKIDRELRQVGKYAAKALAGIALDRALQGSPLSIITAFI